MAWAKELPEFDEEKLLSILWEVANDTAAPLNFTQECKKELNEVLLKGIEKIKNRRTGGNEAKENIRLLVDVMKQKAQEEKTTHLTLEILNVSMKKLSPCWPFS